MPLLITENTDTVRLAPPGRASVAPELTRVDLPRKDLTTIPPNATIAGEQTPALKCYVFVTIDWTKDGVLINSALFDEDGYGRTYDDALEDFLVSLRDKRVSLEKREATLSAADRQVLRKLRESLTVGQ